MTKQPDTDYILKYARRHKVNSFREAQRRVIEERGQRRDIAGMVIMTLCFLLACVGWNAYYVQPRDAAMAATMDCLDERQLEMNQDNWSQCWGIAVAVLSDNS